MVRRRAASFGLWLDETRICPNALYGEISFLALAKHEVRMGGGRFDPRPQIRPPFPNLKHCRNIARFAKEAERIVCDVHLSLQVKFRVQSRLNAGLFEAARHDERNSLRELRGVIEEPDSKAGISSEGRISDDKRPLGFF